MTLDDLLDSYEYAEWITSHSIEYDIIVSNGESLIEAMYNETLIDIVSAIAPCNSDCSSVVSEC